MEMKLYTKLSIIGTAILLVISLVWFWHSAKVSKSPSHKELKSAVKTAHSVPRNKSIVKSKSKSKDNTEELEKFSDKEIEEALEWLDSFSESVEPALSESEQLAEEKDESEKVDDAKIKDEQLKAEAEEIWRRLNQDLSKHKEMLQEEQRLLSIAKAKYGDGIIRNPESRRIWEIRRPRRRLADKIVEEAIIYLGYTGEVGISGWMKQILEEHGLKIGSRPFGSRSEWSDRPKPPPPNPINQQRK